MSLQPAVQPALWTLRIWWKTTTLLVVLGSLGTAAVLPIASLSTWHHDALVPQMHLSPLQGAESALRLSTIAHTLTSLREAAVSLLFGLLLAVAAGLLLVAILAVLTAAWARASLRAQEIAIRHAVGASRRQLCQAGLVESGLIGAATLCIGGAIGLGAAHVARETWPGVSSSLSVEPMLAVLGTVLAVTIVATTVSSLPRRSISRSIGRTGPALELFIPALQLGMSLAVLTTSTLLTRYARRVLGPEHQRSATGRVFTITCPSMAAADRGRLYSHILSMESRFTASQPSLASGGTLFGLGTVDVVITECGNCYTGGFYTPLKEVYAVHYLVSAGTFPALRLRMIAGRAIAEGDTWGAPPVVVVNQSLAEHFERANAVGKKLTFGHLGDRYTVVGIVANQPPIGFGGGVLPPNAIYLSVLQHPPKSVELLAPGGSGDAAIDLGKQLGLGLPPTCRLAQTGLGQLLAGEEAPLVWFGRAFSLEGWTMLAIAFLGTFTLMRLWVESALYELGVRRALGARRRDAIRFVLVRAAAVAIGGTLIGLWFGLIFWGALPEAVAGLEPWDSRAVLAFAGIMAGACFLGALVPACRETAAAPAVILATREH